MKVITKKAARDRGLKTAKEWFSGGMIPRKRCKPLLIKDEEFWCEDQCERVLSRTAWRHEGFRVRPGVGPAGEKYHASAYRHYYVYRESDCVQIPARTSVKEETIDVLSAIFAVNRSAKRYRDAAQTYYLKRMHGLAGDAKKKKINLYNLKDIGIAYAYNHGLINVEKIHARLILYRGGGYCFHSTLAPESVNIENAASDEPLRIEAKPRGVKEPRLKDAIFSLSQLDDYTSQFLKLGCPRLIPDRQDAYL